ncbi:hypothetical protein HYS94_02210 [Candidatus Daviesbacteria bacterium]|nr:hypothetical protein [Candidatus Daviesbacteria bacterium]
MKKQKLESLSPVKKSRIRTTSGPAEIMLPEDPPVFVIEEEEIEDKGKIAILMTARQCECDNNEKCSCEEEKQACSCKDYEGQDFNCLVHEAKVECPVCHTIDTEIFIPNHLPPFNHYRCRICGMFYQRNMVDGMYIRY